MKTHAAAAAALLFCLPVFAEPDANGDYISNLADVQGRTVPGKSPGSLWRVTAPSVDCRKKPDAKSTIVRRYRKAAVIEVEVWRGGSDEVLQNALDSDGHTWMPVRGRTFEDVCYVRANRAFIEPLPARQTK